QPTADTGELSAAQTAAAEAEAKLAEAQSAAATAEAKAQEAASAGAEAQAEAQAAVATAQAEAEAAKAQAEEAMKQAEQAASSAPASEPVTLRAIGFESCIVDGLKLQADAYMKAHPNVTIEIEATAYTNLHDKQVIELASGTGNFDIYSVVTEWMPEYTSAGFLEPLDDYVAADPPEDWPNTWTKGFKFQYGADGKLYGFPHHDGPQLLYYRKDLFEDPDNQAAFKAEYGYDLAPPKTWDQFIDIAKFFTRPEEDLWGTVLTAKFGEQQLAHDFWLLLPGFGGGTGFDENGYPTFNKQGGVEALQFYSDLINKYKVAPEASLTYGIPEAGDFYLSGKAAMHWNWAHIGAYAELEEFSSIIGKNAYTVMPKVEGVGQNAVYASYWVLAIAKDSKNKQVAYDFIKFATDKEHDKLLAEVGCIPSRLSSWNDPQLLEKFPFYATFQPSYEGFITSSPRIPEYEKADDILQRYMSQVLAGETDAQSALDAAVEELIPLLEENGAIKK
ncbi:MAG: extracellular solute-binding protein, partial [Chloroflexi bacterium]